MSASTPEASTEATTAAAPASAPPSESHPCSCAPEVPLSEDWARAHEQATAAHASDATASVSAEEDDTTAPEKATMSAKWAALLGAVASTSNTPATDPQAGAATAAAASTPATAAAAAPVPKPLVFEYEKHVAYFSMHLRSIPQGYEGLDTSRMTMLYFCLSALDVLGALQSTVHDKGLTSSIIEWIYAQQVHPHIDLVTGEENVDGCGFRGGSSGGVPFEPNRTVGHSPSSFPSDHAHIAMTYTALCCLRILGDHNFERVNRRAVVQALRNLQQTDGSFSSTRLRSESDMRFLYCACVISSLLRDWSGFDTARSVAFIARSQAYDGGIGLWPGCEGHGGSTYCAVASLSLMGQLDTAFSKHKQQQLLRWLINNQGEGYRGRPNKPEDCCYSFWIAAALRLFGAHMLPKEVDVLADWTQRDSNRTFNLRCQHARYGGFRKDPSAGHPDLLHAYFGVCGIALIADEADAQKGLQPLDVVLGLTKRAAGGPDQHVRLDGSSW